MKLRDLVLAFGLAAAAATAWATGPAEAAADFTEHGFTLGEGGDMPLPGTLAMPAGEGPFPAVVLVHGSGPNDRDGSIGPNHPLRDIAHGLAARGIAVLRYEKRTKLYPVAAAFDPEFGVDEESTSDAVEAVAALRATPGIDPDRVFVFGHSLGAMLAPRIVARADGAAGGIMYAASPRTMLDLLPEQVERMGELRGADPAATAASLEAINGAIARLRAGADAAGVERVLGASAGYFRSTEALDPVVEARAIAQPLLILHGGLDVQVPDSDWEAWQAAFAGDPRVALRRYPELGHLGIRTDPGSPLAAYEVPGSVDEALLDDVAAWIAAPGG